MKASKLLVGLFALSMLAFTACGQNKDNGATVRAGYNGGLRNGGGSTANQSVQVQNANAQSISQFLSAGTDSSQIGQIQAVYIAGVIGLACSQQTQPVIANGSNGIVLSIIDSYTQSQGPIQIFMPLTGGTVYGGNMQLTFTDSAGSIQIQANYTPNNSSSYVQGTIYFANNGGAQGMIGSFQMPLASFVQCQQ